MKVYRIVMFGRNLDQLELDFKCESFPFPIDNETIFFNSFSEEQQNAIQKCIDTALKLLELDYMLEGELDYWERRKKDFPNWASEVNSISIHEIIYPEIC